MKINKLIFASLLVLCLLFSFVNATLFNETIIIDDDTYTRTNNITENYGNVVTINMGSGENHYHNFIEIDLNIYKNYSQNTINGMLNFIMYVADNMDINPIDYYYCDDDFNELTITYENDDAEVINCDSIPFYSENTSTTFLDGSNYNINITELINKDTDGIFTIKSKPSNLTTSSMFFIVHSSESDYKPNLTIQYNNITNIPINETEDNNLIEEIGTTDLNTTANIILWVFILLALLGFSIFANDEFLFLFACIYGILLSISLMIIESNIFFAIIGIVSGYGISVQFKSLGGKK